MPIHSGSLSLRHAVLSEMGCTEEQVRNLLAYNANHFSHGALAIPVSLPLADEESVEEWRGYAGEAVETGAFSALKTYLPQLNFPIRAGMSEDAEYRAATRGGAPFSEMAAATGLELADSRQLELEIYPTLAGHIPILTVRNRPDFERLINAFLHRNEPRAIPPSMGAAMISGFNNWNRVAKLRREFEALHPAAGALDWNREFARIKPQRHLYQDRFILVSDSQYSGVSMEKRELGLAIRRAHEATHYLTKRLLGSMKNNLLDELIADYAGIVAAEGTFRADWFLLFMGLEDFPRYREGGRFQNYLADPPLPPDCFGTQRELLVRAANAVAAFDGCQSDRSNTERGRALMPLALSRLTLEELASKNSAEILGDALARATRDFVIPEDWRER